MLEDFVFLIDFLAGVGKDVVDLFVEFSDTHTHMF